MIRHLTEDQITRWFVGQATAAERQHVHQCDTCTSQVDRFKNTLGLFQAAIADRVERTFEAPPTTSMIVEAHAAPSLFVFDNLVEAPSFPKWLSVALHAAIVGVLMIPAALPNVLLPVATSVTMLIPSAPLLLPPGQGRTEGGGGGGGGMRTPTPPSKGIPPRGTDRQLLPPMVEAKNLAPDLVIEPTIIAPALANLPQFSFITIGDPNGVAGPPSAGPGRGGGIGDGIGPGVGGGTGPGAGVGHDGGAGGNGPEVYGLVGGVTAPRVLTQIMPEYSDDARKGRIQGTVELLAIVNADGSVTLERVAKSLGYGLDQKAIDAVLKWKFRPGTKDGKPVAVLMRIGVNFTLR
jgi:protein TonB